MKLAGAKQETVFLTGANAVVRALGLGMRIFLSRFLGAEIMGIVELAQSLHMLVITPFTSGLPAAITRLTARANSAHRQEPLAAGLKLIRFASFVAIPLLWTLSPWISVLSGDIRVLPSLLFTIPCIFVLGYSAAYNGYCYAVGQITKPAISELLEQLLRLAVSFLLLWAFPKLTVPWLAAVPAFATLIAELAGLMFMVSCFHAHFLPKQAAQHWQKKIVRLAFPISLSRLIQTFFRSITAILIPIRLQHSGLLAAEATSQFGMFQGMVSPILMLPCIFTSALSMVAMPRLVRAEKKPGELKRLLGLSLTACLPVSILCSVIVYVCSPLLSQQVYRIAELTPLFRLSAPLVVLYALGHMGGTVLTSLGLQALQLWASVLTSAITLGLTWFLCADASWRIHGVILAQYAGQLLSIFSSVLILLIWKTRRRTCDKSF